jgi:hypothetical protein
MNDPNAMTPVRRYWRLVGIMAAVAAVAIVGALWYLQRSGTPLRLHVALATGLGVGLTLLLAGVLMGLVFFSARSGHDQAVSDETRDTDDL